MIKQAKNPLNHDPIKVPINTNTIIEIKKAERATQQKALSAPKNLYYI
jgi:hypothetical protein